MSGMVACELVHLRYSLEKLDGLRHFSKSLVRVSRGTNRLNKPSSPSTFEPGQVTTELGGAQDSVGVLLKLLVRYGFFWSDLDAVSIIHVGMKREKLPDRRRHELQKEVFGRPRGNRKRMHPGLL